MRNRRDGSVVRALPWMGLAASMLLGFMSSTKAHGEDWSLPDSRVGIRTAPLLLLSRPDVQVDLRLETAQVMEVRKAINDLTQRALALRGKTGAAVISERRAIDQAQLDWLGQNLSGNQLERLHQIELQWEGAGAMLSRPRVAESLKLTTEQRQNLARIVTERNAARVRGGPTTAGDEATFNMKALSQLTDPQRELWGKLLGTPIAFAGRGPRPGTRDAETQQAVHGQKLR